MLILLSLFACSNENVAEMPQGDFALYDVEVADHSVEDFAGMALSIDVEGLKMSLTLPDGSVQEAALVEQPQDEWPTDCYTMNSHVVVQSFDVDIDSLTIGDVVLEAPVLSSKCGGRPMLGAWDDAEKGLGAPLFIFE